MVRCTVFGYVDGIPEQYARMSITEPGGKVYPDYADEAIKRYVNHFSGAQGRHLVVTHDTSTGTERTFTFDVELPNTHTIIRVGA